MRAKSRAIQDEEDIELDMTPMLDVVFILLIFFIVTAVFVKRPGVDIEKPVISQDEQRNPSVLVAVMPNDQVWIDKSSYTVQNIQPVLQSLKDQNPELEIVLQGDNGAKIGTVLDVQEVISGLQIPVYVNTEPQ
ncbi:MAG: biopolymer transporter ExbD [Euryhalocaulis sp.]|uniref:ExbD/TolR family protein n=1 Tax=Euryhalocaulis sp. TaxID=2744307 RepID=UPI001820DAC0|nr:biopolymer transporter ExbD [Euryhalocaulis sp.]MBA4802451.1 biopolymer transporter ExbD [Euryhalocaulis sp.]